MYLMYSGVISPAALATLQQVTSLSVSLTHTFRCKINQKTSIQTSKVAHSTILQRQLILSQWRGIHLM